MINYQSIGDRIRQARKAARLTQEQLAERIDRCSAFVGHIERGDRKLSVETLCKVCDVLGITTDWVLGRINNNSPSE